MKKLIFILFIYINNLNNFEKALNGFLTTFLYNYKVKNYYKYIFMIYIMNFLNIIINFIK